MNWKVWVPIGCVVLTALLGWGVHVTLTAWAALPEAKFEQHEKEDRANQQRIEDKLDRIQETIINLHKGE